jgi:1-deoxy-D-xylulose 5-phosphate reductoisomerase
MGLRLLQGLKKMKKIFILTALALSACGTEKEVQIETFKPQFITVSKSAVCENLDASVREELDASTVAELCGVESVCSDFEVVLDCTGEWCVTHRTCRLTENP